MLLLAQGDIESAREHIPIEDGAKFDKFLPWKTFFIPHTGQFNYERIPIVKSNNTYRRYSLKSVASHP